MPEVHKRLRRPQPQQGGGRQNAGVEGRNRDNPRVGDVQSRQKARTAANVPLLKLGHAAGVGHDGDTERVQELVAHVQSQRLCMNPKLARDACGSGGGFPVTKRSQMGRHWAEIAGQTEAQPSPRANDEIGSKI